MFKPSNADGREPISTAGLMFKINRCNFSSDLGHAARLTNIATSSGNATSNSDMDSMKVVADIMEFTNTGSLYHYYSTSKDASSKGSAEQFTINKKISI